MFEWSPGEPIGVDIFPLPGANKKGDNHDSDSDNEDIDDAADEDDDNDELDHNEPIDLDSDDDTMRES